MKFRPLLGAALLGLLLPSCNGMGGSEDVGDGETTFEVVGATPADGAPTVPVGATITWTFNVPIDESSVDFNTVGVTPTTFGNVSVDGTALTFDPAGDLSPATTYVFTISPELKGTNGHALGVMANPYGFKTGGIAPPPDTLPPSGPRPR